jgi:hypothetical protein
MARRRCASLLGQDTLDSRPPDVVAKVVQGVTQPRVAPVRRKKSVRAMITGTWVHPPYPILTSPAIVSEDGS